MPAGRPGALVRDAAMEEGSWGNHGFPHGLRHVCQFRHFGLPEDGNRESWPRPFRGRRPALPAGRPGALVRDAPMEEGAMGEPSVPPMVSGASASSATSACRKMVTATRGRDRFAAGGRLCRPGGPADSDGPPRQRRGLTGEPWGSPVLSHVKKVECGASCLDTSPFARRKGCASVQNSSGPSDGGGEQLISRKRGLLSVLALLVAVLALVAAGCGGDDESSSGGTTTGASGGSGRQHRGVAVLVVHCGRVRR